MQTRYDGNGGGNPDVLRRSAPLQTTAQDYFCRCAAQSDPGKSRSRASGRSIAANGLSKRRPRNNAPGRAGDIRKEIARMKDCMTLYRNLAKKYPLAAPQDAVKLAYQSVYGGGHLITDRARVWRIFKRKTKPSQRGNGPWRKSAAVMPDCTLATRLWMPCSTCLRAVPRGMQGNLMRT